MESRSFRWTPINPLRAWINRAGIENAEKEKDADDQIEEVDLVMGTYLSCLLQPKYIGFCL